MRLFIALLLVSATFSVCWQFQPRIKEKKIYSYKSPETGTIMPDSSLSKVVLFSQSGNIISEEFPQDNIKYEYIHNDKDEIVKIIEKKAGHVVHVTQASFSDDGEAIPYLLNESPEFSCDNPTVTCTYYKNGMVASKRKIDEVTGKVFLKEAYIYSYYN